jgi:hypothetical protein
VGEAACKGFSGSCTGAGGAGQGGSGGH